MADGYMQSANRLLRHLHRNDPADLSVTKDLAISYQYLKQYRKSWDCLRRTIEDSTADDQCYQLACNDLKALNRKDEVTELLRNGIKRFPLSGPLYLEMGNVFASLRSDSALCYWETGIKLDPAYPRNYYYAAKYHMAEEHWLSAFLLGAYYVNKETSGSQHVEMKTLIALAHRNWMTSILEKEEIKKNQPELQRIERIARQQRDQLAMGNNVEDWTAFHIRLVFDWFNNNPEADKISLIAYHRELLRNGHFESYVQWLLGSVTNQSAFQRWYHLHESAYHAFKRYMQQHPFKPGSIRWLNGLNIQ